MEAAETPKRQSLSLFPTRIGARVYAAVSMPGWYLGISRVSYGSPSQFPESCASTYRLPSVSALRGNSTPKTPWACLAGQRNLIRGFSRADAVGYACVSSFLCMYLPRDRPRVFCICQRTAKELRPEADVHVLAYLTFVDVCPGTCK